MEALTDQTVSRSVLAADELAREVKMLGKRWALDDKDLKLELFSRSMTKLAAAIAFAATLSDEMDIHPSIALAYPKLGMTIQPYDDKSITVLDLVYAARLEQWLRENGW
jgi:pterin-4a-carbinolamine dehydratase